MSDTNQYSISPIAAAVSAAHKRTGYRLLVRGSAFHPDRIPVIGTDVPQTGSISEFVPKFALTWNVNDTKMMYGSYTEGFRSGGINRGNKNADWTRTLYPQNWEPDKLKNYEIGARTRWANNTLQLNATLFYMEWEDFQTEVVDPSYGACRDTSLPAGDCGPPVGGISSTLPWLSIVGNAGDAHISGISADLAWIPADGWDVGANLQYLELIRKTGSRISSRTTKSAPGPAGPTILCSSMRPSSIWSGRTFKRKSSIPVTVLAAIPHYPQATAVLP